jgi:predicted AlkP superfamily phosphohydrolase/phosphomutase/tetratricopeptide (TPR) repeat protein
MTNKKVLLIGWDAADWNSITPLMDQGKMPHLQGLVERGVMGNMATLYPALSPMLWTSIATGKRPFKHGIYGFSEPTPDGQGIRPVSNLSRRTRALWNMLHTQEMKSNIIGWWPSHPVEPINGVMISNMYHKQTGRLNRDEGPDAPARPITADEVVAKMKLNWPLPPNAIHPASLREPLANLRIHPQELTATAILPFLPKLAEIDQENDHRPETIAKTLCECSTVHAAATAVMQLEPWNLMAVYYDAIDHFGHGFMQYHPPRLPWINERDFEHYQNVMETAYCYHDMMLGTLLQLAGKETTIILVSDHGFHSDHNRPRQVANEAAGPAEEHAHYGIFVMAGPEIKQDERIYGASLLDVAPTLLHTLGLPIGEDMDGKVLINAFKTDRPVKTIPSWDLVEGEDGSHGQDFCQDPLSAKAALDQLVELGYIEKPDENISTAVEKTTLELEYNLARSYMDAGMYAYAAEILQQLRERFPNDTRFGIQRINCQLQLKQLDGIEAALCDLEKQKAENVEQARTAMESQFGPYKNADGQWDLSTASEEMKRSFKKLLLETQTIPYALNILRASLYVAQERHAEAKTEFEVALKKGAGHTVRQAAAENLVQLGDEMEALAFAQQVLQVDPKNARAYLTQAKIHYKRQNIDLAESLATQSISLLYHNPEGHLWLARAASRQGKIPRAVESLEIALQQAPYYTEAIEELLNIYTQYIKNPSEAKRLTKTLSEARNVIESMREGTFDTQSPRWIRPQALTSDHTPQPHFSSAPTAALEQSILIVSGLPRSGTSMMMQMLAAAGIPIVTDGKREADAANPNGYFEFTDTATLRRNNDWVSTVVGQAMKVVAPLLPALPLNQQLHYRLFFMERDLDEVLQSQQKMVSSVDSDQAARDLNKLKSNYQQQLALSKRFIHAHKIPACYINYHECIHHPQQTAEKINRFLDAKFDPHKMANAIVPTLYRNRKTHI